MLVWISSSTYPTTKDFVQTFFWKKYGFKIPYLSAVWTYVQNFVFFFILNPLLTKPLGTVILGHHVYALSDASTLSELLSIYP